MQDKGSHFYKINNCGDNLLSLGQLLWSSSDARFTVVSCSMNATVAYFTPMQVRDVAYDGMCSWECIVMQCRSSHSHHWRRRGMMHREERHNPPKSSLTKSTNWPRPSRTRRCWLWWNVVACHPQSPSCRLSGPACPFFRPVVHRGFSRGTVGRRLVVFLTYRRRVNRMDGCGHHSQLSRGRSVRADHHENTINHALRPPPGLQREM